MSDNKDTRPSIIDYDFENLADLGPVEPADSATFARVAEELRLKEGE